MTGLSQSSAFKSRADGMHRDNYKEYLILKNSDFVWKHKL